MAGDVIEQDSELARLYLRHDGGSPDVRQTGAIFERLAVAYHGYTRLGFQKADYASDLQIAEINAGSLFVLFGDTLELTSSVLTLYEHRDLLGGFVAQLSDALAAMSRMPILQKISLKPLPMYRNALEALAAPVRTGRASYVQLSVVGDNNNVLIITGKEAKAISSFLKDQKAKRKMRSARKRGSKKGK